MSTPKTKIALCILLFNISICSFFNTAAHSEPAPLIAAASDLSFALATLSTAFTQDTGLAVNISTGSSGNLARQINQGGPYEVFLSADEHYVLELHNQGLTIDKGVLYAQGRLVIFKPTSSTLPIDSQLHGLKKALLSGSLKHFAIANPEHAPYGRAAKQALISTDLWGAIQPNLVLGENVSQAAQFAHSGAAQGALIAYSLALAPAFKHSGHYALLSEHLHAPLNQRMVLLKSATSTAKRFYAYLQTSQARAIFERYGFNLPD